MRGLWKFVFAILCSLCDSSLTSQTLLLICPLQRFEEEMSKSFKNRKFFSFFEGLRQFLLGKFSLHKTLSVSFLLVWLWALSIQKLSVLSFGQFWWTLVSSQFPGCVSVEYALKDVFFNQLIDYVLFFSYRWFGSTEDLISFMLFDLVFQHFKNKEN